MSSLPQPVKHLRKSVPSSRKSKPEKANALYVGSEIRNYPLTPNQRALVMHIHSVGKNGCYKSVGNLASECGMSRRTAFRNLPDLVTARILSAEPCAGPRGRTTRYRVRPSEYWMLPDEFVALRGAGDRSTDSAKKASAIEPKRTGDSATVTLQQCQTGTIDSATVAHKGTNMKVPNMKDRGETPIDPLDQAARNAACPASGFSAGEFREWVRLNITIPHEEQDRREAEMIERIADVVRDYYADDGDRMIESITDILIDDSLRGYNLDQERIGTELYDRLTAAGYTVTANWFGSDLLVTGGPPMDDEVLALIRKYENALCGGIPNDVADQGLASALELCETHGWEFEEHFARHTVGAPIRYLGTDYPNVAHQLHLRGAEYYSLPPGQKEDAVSEIPNQSPGTEPDLPAEPEWFRDAPILDTEPPDGIGQEETEFYGRRTTTIAV